MRGKPTYLAETEFSGRLIPACAGKTWAMTLTPLFMQAHPRVCGENSPTGILSSQTTGSSPRVRGKQPLLKDAEAVGGLIPACAGKTEC